VECRYEVVLDTNSPFFDPSDGVIIVAFTRGEVSSEQLCVELQHASNEGILSGDFQVARVVARDRTHDGIAGLWLGTNLGHIHDGGSGI